jgi:hypothetical protein
MSTLVVALVATITFYALPQAQAQSGSDAAFDHMVGTMSGRDTGSLWFDYYLAELNQDIAAKDDREPYGAAGPEGPVSGFDGYVNSFLPPDTGSMWLNHYVDSVNRDIWEHRQHE